MTSKDLIRDAGRGVRLYRIRSLLVAASFAAGTGAAIALFATTDGARAELLARIRAWGADLVVIRPVGEAPGNRPPPLALGDAEALAQSFPFVRAIAPVRTAASNVLLPDERVTVRVIGTTPEYFGLMQLPFRRGFAFPVTDRPLCVLGPGAARHLFPSGGAYGSLVKVGGNWYRVVGILGADSMFGAATSGGGEGAGREVYLPIAATYRQDHGARQPLREAWLRIDGSVSPVRAASIIERGLRRRQGAGESIEVVTAERLLRQHRAARGLLDLLLSVVAVAAFGLAGVGMMAVSWRSVADRSREIAIRRAVGARREEIWLQFVVEGVGLAAVGAAAGAIAGVLVSGAVAWAAGWPWLLSPLRVSATVGMALVVALLSTLYPAYRATTLDPAAALRSRE